MDLKPAEKSSEKEKETLYPDLEHAEKSGYAGLKLNDMSLVIKVCPMHYFVPYSLDFPYRQLTWQPVGIENSDEKT